MKLNRFDKTVIIPIRVAHGSLEYFYGGPLPKLREGTISELRVPEEAVLDKGFLQKLDARDSVELLRKGDTLYAAVSSYGIPRELSSRASSIGVIVPDKSSTEIAAALDDALLVEVELREPLFLELRGTKLSRLKPARCYVPSLETEARSLNHAYRLISERFEPNRISHTGNVFQKMLYKRGSDGRCVLLDDLRNLYEAQKEPRFQQTPASEAMR